MKVWPWILAVLALGAGIAYRIVFAPPAAPAVPDPASLLPESKPAVLAAPQIAFTDITRSAGIDFIHHTGATGARLLPETMGGGGGFVDFDDDGDADIVLIDSGDWPHSGKPPRRGVFVYRNDGSGRFTEVGGDLGLDAPGYGMGFAAADVEGDGDLDLLVTGVGGNRFWLQQDGRFTESADTSGLAGSSAAWTTAAAFFDSDADGDLDALIAEYVDWTPAVDQAIGFQLAGIGRAYGPPTAFRGALLHHYRNEGAARFVEVTEPTGFALPDSGPQAKALSLLPFDAEGDGDLDVFVANDTVQNFLFEQYEPGRYRERGHEFGLAFDRNGLATGAMGSDAAHFRNDDQVAVAVGNFANEMTSIYVGGGALALYSDDAGVVGVGAASRSALSFGLLFGDYDLDGRQDLVQANGHIEPEIARVQASQSHAQAAQLFWNCGAACAREFEVLPASAVADLATPRVGRAVSHADIDGDGDLDLLLVQNGAAPALLRNDQRSQHDWLILSLRQPGPNPTAIGARVVLQQGAIRQQRWVMPSRSYLSQVGSELHFGLGSAAVDRLSIVWPDGQRQTVDPSALARNHHWLVSPDGKMRVRKRAEVAEAAAP